MRRLLSLAVLLLATSAEAAPQDAVVRLISHGASGTVIYSVPGRSLVLSCGHAFESEQDRRRPIQLNAPHPAPTGERRRAGVRLVAWELDVPAQREVERIGREGRMPPPHLLARAQLDLSLVEVGAQLPYACRVAPKGYRPGLCVSVGYDKMRLPGVREWAHIYGHAGTGGETYTREPPVPGRSGGALIDQASGQLVGVVVAFRFDHRTRQPTTGVYVSHAAVLGFLGRHAPEALGRARAPVAPTWPPARPALPPLCPT